MDLSLSSRFKNAWNAFRNRAPTMMSQNIGSGYSYRPDRFRLTRGNERSIVTSVYNRIALDVAAINIQHVQLDDEGRFLNVIKSGLNECLSLEANLDQTGTVGGGSGLNRRELFTDARDISSNVGSDDALTDAEYMAQLQQRGKEKLAENVSITSFEGETETTIMFQYGKDFFNGDIVQIANEYGHETKARILEIVRSEDKDGYSVYPTFKTIEQEGA